MNAASKFWLMLLGIGLALGLGEWAVRAFNLGPDLYRVQRGMIRLTSDPGLRYELAPNYVSPARDVVINARGMRNRPVEPAKTPGIRRIACIGDSIAFGMGTSRDPFSIQLEDRLNGGLSEGENGYETLNFGVPGYNVGQVAAMLAGRVGDYAPDLVLYLLCLNDPQETSRELEGILRWREMPPAQSAYIRRLWDSSRSALGGSRLWMLVRLSFASFFRRPAIPQERYRDDMEIILEGRGESYYRSLYAEGPARERWRAGLDEIARWSQKTGVPVWLVVFPLFVDLDRYRLEDLHQVVRVEGERRGLRVLDLLSAYQAALRAGQGPFHADPLHPNREGYGIAARAVAEVLQGQGATAAPASP